MWLLILGLFLFVLLIVLHEYGHFLVAKRNGVEVEEFGIGFPPKLYGKKLGKGIFEGYYTINALPLGGFVRLKGENDADKQKGSFGAASTKAKLRIMLAGVAMNLLAAIFIFTIVSWVGMPQLIPNQFTVASDSTVIRDDVYAAYVDENSPASKAGIVAGDVVISIANEPVNSEVDLRRLTESNAGQTVEVTFDQNGQARTADVTLLTTEEVTKSRETDSPKGYLGVVPRDYTLIRSTWSALVVAACVSTQFAGLTVEAVANALYNLGKAVVDLVFSGASTAKETAAKAGKDVSGPVGIFVVLQQGADLGFQFTLFVVGILSLTLAVMNFLPIPALDGGRAFVMLLFRAIKKPLTPELEERIHGTGFAILMLLFIVITVVDVRRFF